MNNLRIVRAKVEWVYNLKPTMFENIIILNIFKFFNCEYYNSFKIIKDE